MTINLYCLAGGLCAGTRTHRLHTEWQWPLSGVHSIMREKSAQPGVGGGMDAHPLLSPNVT
jgi:hypothetical protein